MFKIHPPTKKNNYYFSKITQDNNHVVLKVPYASIAQMVHLSKQDGYMVTIDVSQDQNAADFIKSLETTCLQTIISHNKKWFRNALDESVIQEMFDPTLVQATVRSYISLLRSHLEVPGYADFPEWFHQCKLPAPFHITLVCDGLFIYPNRFGIRWIIRSIKENKEEPDDIVPEYGEIITYWEEKVEAQKKILDELMVELKTHFSDKAVAQLKKYIL